MNLNGLDPTDITILNLIQKDARLTHKEIAWKTNKSLSAIQVRVRKLLSIGVIRRFVTLLDRSMINKGLAVFTMIKLNNYTQQALLEFQQSAGALEEVMECYHVSGDRDFILKVVIKDMVEYNAFILEKLSLVPHINSVQSLFVIGETKYETSFNL